MKRLISNYRNNNTIDDKEYQLYKQDLNWRDDGNDSPDGQGVEDPSMNDFIKGYKLEPYTLRYWAKAKADRKLMKLAWKEVDVLSFSPEYLADKILKLWNQIDGTLQNTFEAFTLRYDNKLKQEIANIINKQGYEVYPILLVDCPMYASTSSMYANTSSMYANTKINITGNTIACNHLRKDLQYIAKTTTKRTFTKKANMIIDFYKQAFPNDKYIKLAGKDYRTQLQELGYTEQDITNILYELDEYEDNNLKQDLFNYIISNYSKNLDDNVLYYDVQDFVTNYYRGNWRAGDTYWEAPGMNVDDFI